MNNLTIIAHDGHSYELTSRYSQPQSSAAQLYRNDPYLTQRFIAHLPIEPDTWLRLLGNIGLRHPNIGYGRLGDIHQQVADAIARNDINLYRLPRLDETNCLRGKKDTGLCIIQGPKPHCATRLAPLSIDSPQAASDLLNELGITPSALIAHLRQQHLCEDDNSLNPLDDVLTRLAKGELLAYKIPLPPPAAPKKAVEFVPAAGPGYEPVTLGPETTSPPKSSAPIMPPPAEKPVNPELEARAKELEEIGADLRTNGFTPTSDEEVMQAVNTGDLGNRRFLVSIQKNKSHDEPVGYRRKDTGRTTMWTTTYDMLKKGDTSAPLLMALLGSTYEPGAQYTMYLLDQGENFEQDGALTFVPTWENMQKYGPDELHKDNPEDPVRDKALLASVMNPETQMKYQKTMEEFWRDADEKNRSEYIGEHINAFLAKKAFSPSEQDEFKARHLYRTQIGANAYFLGSGATEFTLHDSNKAAIFSDNIRLNGTPGKIGVPEMLTIEKDPPSIAQLEQKGFLKAIPLKGINV